MNGHAALLLNGDHPDDSLGIRDDAAIVEEDVHPALRRQQRADVSLHHEIWLASALIVSRPSGRRRGQAREPGGRSLAAKAVGLDIGIDPGIGVVGLTDARLAADSTSHNATPPAHTAKRGQGYDNPEQLDVAL